MLGIFQLEFLHDFLYFIFEEKLMSLLFALRLESYCYCRPMDHGAPGQYASSPIVPLIPSRVTPGHEAYPNAR